LPAIQQTEKCKLVALVSDHPDKAKELAAKYNVQSNRIYDYDNFDTIKDADDVDVIYIVLPNSHHKDFTVRALKAGKHVLCEKPMANTVQECQEMIDAANKYNKKLMIAYRLHYEPHHRKAIKMMKSMGDLRLFEATHSQQTEAPNIRLSKKLGGGPVEDVGIYCLNAARYISGEEPIEVSAMGVSPEGDDRFREVYGHVTFQMRFPSGALGVCSCGFDSIRSDRFRGTGDKGYVEMDPAFGYHSLQLKTCKKDVGGEYLVESNHNIAPVNHFAKEMDHFSGVVLEGKKCRSTGEEGMADIRVIEAIRESCAKGGAVVKIAQPTREKTAHI